MQDIEDPEFLNLVNEKYLKEFQSLNKTCQWLEETYGIRVNRIKLSRLFHTNNLEVQAPNGKPALWYGEDTSSWRSKEAEFAADWVQLLFDDIRAYLEGEGARIHFMSACWAFSGEIYRQFLMTLQAGGPLLVDPNTLPPGLSEELVLHGRDLYQRNKLYWVDTDGN